MNVQGQGTRGLAYHEGGQVLNKCNRVGVDVSAKELVVAIEASDRREATIVLANDVALRQNELQAVDASRRCASQRLAVVFEDRS